MAQEEIVKIHAKDKRVVCLGEGSLAKRSEGICNVEGYCWSSSRLGDLVVVFGHAVLEGPIGGE